MGNIPKEVIKKKKSLEVQAKKLLKDTNTDFYEKVAHYCPEKCVNEYMAIYYASRQS